MMISTSTKELTGRKVLVILCSAFAVIIGVNLTLAYHAVATFPGLETRNSYVASQAFDTDRARQVALDWEVSSRIDTDMLRLSFRKDGQPVQPEIVSAILGRATNVAQDQTPHWTYDGRDFVAPVKAGRGNWNLRLVAKARDGTLFRQRVIVGQDR